MFATLRFLLIFLVSIPLWASEQNSAWYSMDAKKQVSLNVDLFLSSTCPHCHKADEFFKEIEPKNPWLHVQRHIINQDKEALRLFSQFLAQQKLNDFSVPSIFFCDSRWLGFLEAETTGVDLLKGLQYCKQQIEKDAQLSHPVVEVLRRWANANMLNSSVTEQPSILHYLMVVVFLDASNPCALFCILSLLALLFIQKSKRNQLITGFLFIVAVVCAHSMQQLQTNLFYQLLPWYRIISLPLALLSLYVVVRYYKQESLKPYLLFIWTFVFSLSVYAYQQTCVMNWVYVFQQWLSNQHLAAGQEFALQVIYQFFYVLPLIVLLVLYLLCSSLQVMQRTKFLFEQMGLAFIALIALIMLLQPSLLSAYLASYLVFMIGFIIGFISKRYHLKNK